MQKEIILKIDTASNKEISVGLVIDKKEDTIVEKIGKNKAQVVLPLVEKLLEKHRLQPINITRIEVHEGPGSFTGLRVGVAIANALSFVLNIPINKKTLGEFAEPKYD